MKKKNVMKLIAVILAVIMTVLSPATVCAVETSIEETVEAELSSEETVEAELSSEETVEAELPSEEAETYEAIDPDESSFVTEDVDQGTVTVIHNEGDDYTEAESNEYGILEEDYYEDLDNASGGVIPVKGFELSDEDLMREEVVGNAYYPEQYFTQSSAVIGDQGTSQSCWAFSAMTCADLSLLEGSITDSVNLSEKHLQYGYYNRSGERGIPSSGYSWLTTTGSMYMPIAAMAELLGAADETLYPYNSGAVPEEEYTNDIAHLDEAVILPNFSSSSDSWKGDSWTTVIEQIKSAVMENGAVWISCYSHYNTTEWYTEWPSTSTEDDAGNVTLTYGDKPSPDHAVTIVGWDDTKEIDGTENPGAWYVQNSWGENWGESGYFWLSYEDASQTNPVTYHMEQSELGKMRDTEVFSHSGVGYNGRQLYVTPKTYGVNVFTTDHSVTIDRVGFYTSRTYEEQYQVELIADITDMSDPESGTVVASAQGTVSGAGFHKVDLDTSVAFESGDAFAVKVICLDTTNNRYDTVFEGVSTSIREVTCEEGTSYFYYGSTAYDCATSTNVGGVNLAGKYHNVCIYAYGVSRLKISGDVTTATRGDSFELDAYYDDGEGETEVTPEWNSDSESVTISQEGLVTVDSSAVTESVLITATYNGYVAKYRLIIEVEATAAEVTGLKMVGIPETSLLIGQEEVTNESGISAVTLQQTTDPSLRLIVSESGTGYFKLENFYTGLYLTADSDGDDWSYVTWSKWETANTHRWKIFVSSSGYILRNKATGTYLSILDPTGEENDYIIASGSRIDMASEWTLTAARLTIAKSTMTLAASAAYTGNSVELVPKIRYGYRTLKKGTHYTLSYKNNVNAGKATVTATGTGYMYGSKLGTFVIVKSASSVTSGKNYMIVPINGPTRAVTVEKASMKPNMRLYLCNQYNSESQKFIFTKNSDGTYTLTDQKSDLVMGIRNDETKNSAFLGTQMDTGSEMQRWNVLKNSDGSYRIVNAGTDKAMYLKGGTTTAETYIGQYTYSGNTIMHFYLVEVSAMAHTYSNTYTIRCAGNTGVALEIVHGLVAGGANAQLNTYSGGVSQVFRLMYSGSGYYRIMNVNSGRVLGIQGESKTNGANVRQASWIATNGQRWKVFKNTDRSITLKSALGTALDMYGGASSPGTNVISWTVNGTAAQKWKLVKVS